VGGASSRTGKDTDRAQETRAARGGRRTPRACLYNAAKECTFLVSLSLHARAHTHSEENRQPASAPSTATTWSPSGLPWNTLYAPCDGARVPGVLKHTLCPGVLCMYVCDVTRFTRHVCDVTYMFCCMPSCMYGSISMYVCRYGIHVGMYVDMHEVHCTCICQCISM
jgi:hypothetical protein